jgi:DNA-binding CsgD family transcriptional regulator
MLRSEAEAYRPSGDIVAYNNSRVSDRELPGTARISLHSSKFDLQSDVARKLFRSGLLVLDAHRNVMCENANATAILAGAEVLRIANGCLVIEKAHIQRGLDEQLRRVAAAVTEEMFDPGEISFIGVPDRTGAVRYALKVIGAAKRDQGPEILVAVVDLAERTGPSRRAFTAVFGLSEREAELAELFALGWRLEEISKKMNVALNTVRVHLRSIFSKTNCTGQLELMRVLSRLAL